MDELNSKHVAIFSNYFWTIYNFRKPLILELLKRGYKVTAIASHDEYTSRTKALGCDVLVIKNLDPKSSSYLQELKLLGELIGSLKRLDCKYVFTFTIKPNIFTAITSRLTRKKVVITINGRGNFFKGEQPSFLLSQMFSMAFNRASTIIFQNREDFLFFKNRKILTHDRVVFTRGSGVNADFFGFKKRLQPPGDELVFLMACRLLKEKGVFEYLAAAEKIKQQHPGIQFHLLGVKAINNSAINAEDLDIYSEKGIIETLEKTDNINGLLEQADVLVLPSYYYEGIPKILLEGLSKGMPIITTDWVGCRETVENGRNGFLIEPRSVTALEAAMKKMIIMPPKERQEMGEKSRQLALSQFDEQAVIDTYISCLEKGNLK